MKKIGILILNLLLIFVLGITIDLDVQASDTLVPLVIDGKNVYHYETSDNVMIPAIYTEKDTEFRGVWVATVWNIDLPQHTSETQYKSEFTNLIDELIANNMNVMVFQVRSQNDAFFDSDYAPWSRWVTGTEGVDPGWDLMTWMINECHANGIEFHAWLNPYRVANKVGDPSTYLNTLHDENWAKQNPDKVILGNSYEQNGLTITPIILNPGEPAVKQYIRDVITEIFTDYDVDGIHFDDYFYPSSGTSSDTETYNTYKETDQLLADWRRENVNDVIRGVKEDVDAYNLATGESVKFGVSPSGVWASDQQIQGGSNTHPAAHDSYFTQYADTKKWVEEEWLHYISPQIYRDFNHLLIPYADIVDWWASVARGTTVDLIIGHSLYMTFFDDDEVSTQFLYNQQHPEIKGSLMYSAKWMIYDRFQNAVTARWTTTPSAVWETSTVSGPDVAIAGTLLENVYITDVVVTLTADEDILYSLDDGDWTAYTVPIIITGAGAHKIYMKTVDGLGEESLLSSRNIPIQYRNPDVPTISLTGDQMGDNYLVGSTISVESDGTDIYVAINHGSAGDFELYTGPITLDDDGLYYIRAKTIDSSGTSSEEVILTVTTQNLCYLAPTISVTGSGSDPFFQEATITLTGETDLEYKINDGSWTTYLSPLIIDTDGEYTITYRNDDECLIEYTKEIVIDQTSPSDAVITIDGTYDGEKYYTTATKVTFSTSEEDTEIKYRLHNGRSWTVWMNYTEPIDLLYSANYTFEYQVVDLALNASEVLTQRVRLMIPPSETNPYVIRDGLAVTYYNSNVLIELPTEYTEKIEEIRGIWVATVGNIDVPLYENEEQYKYELLKMLDVIEANNFNVIFFQVRPMNDAFYDSDYAPWSRFITGVEGQDPGWDILAFMIEEAHKRGIELHAWLNPYRVSTGTESKEAQLAALDENNFARQNPDLVMVDGAGKLILNPGSRQVQVYIRNVIQELMSNYDIDGIHFDDYFYSYNGTSESEDSELYNRLKEIDQSIDDWRRENINTVIREIFEVVEEYNTNYGKTVKFGISPFGIWLSGGVAGSNTATYALQSYKDQYADTKRWVEEGWVHYILPQVYWEFDHSAAPFADLVDWWATLCEKNDVDLIIGHGFYRYDDDSWDNTNELPEQLRYISQYDIIIGSTFFTYNTLLSIDKEVVEFLDRLNNYYWTEYATFPWESTVEKAEDLVCGIGEHEVDGVCVLICPVGEEYVDGDCQSVCGIDQTYTDGECVYDACPDGYERIDSTCELIPEEPKGCALFNITSFMIMGFISLAGFYLSRKWFI